MAQILTIEQFTSEVAQEIASQLKIDPSALVKSLVDSLSKGLVDKLIINKDTLPIQQKDQKTETPPKTKTPKKSESLLNKNVENAILKIPVLSNKIIDILQKQSKSTPSVPKGIKIPSFAPIIKAIKGIKIPAAVKETVTPEVKAPPSFLEKDDKDQRVVFDGFTEKGLKKLTEVFPSILKSGLKDLIKSTPLSKDTMSATTPGSKGMLGELKNIGKFVAGLAGLGTLIYGLETDGPFKGLAKLGSIGLLKVSGWTKLVSNFAKGIVDKLMKLPKNLIRGFSRSVASIFGKEAGISVLKTGLGSLKGFIPNLIKGAGEFLKKVPFVGALISLGFAFSRFKQGDYVGGGLEVLSGIASIFPGIGTGVSIAIDGLNAFLDYKAGGTPQGGGKEKGSMITDFLKGIGQKIKDILPTLPIIGPLIDAFSSINSDNLVDGLTKLSLINPVFGMLASVLSTTSQAVASVTGIESFENPFTKIKDAFVQKAKDVWKSSVEWLKGIMDKILPSQINTDLNEGQLSKESFKKNDVENTQKPINISPVNEDKKLPVKQPDQTSQPSVDQKTITPVVDTQNTTQTEDDKSIDHLSKIVSNTEATNKTITGLVVGFNTLAKAIEKLGISAAVNKGNNTTIVNGNQTSSTSIPTASDYTRSGNSDISSFRNFVEQSRQRIA